jgi:LytS/YehU family sensor histidine kinase
VFFSRPLCGTDRDEYRQQEFTQEEQDRIERQVIAQSGKAIAVRQATIETQRWIIVSGCLSFFSLLLIGYMFSQREKRKREALEQDLQIVQQNALRQQMNPHFIFNALSSIQYFILNNDKTSSNDYITKFASLMRMILENSQFDLIALRDELAMIRLYLELEAMRFQSGFRYTVSGPEDEAVLDQTLPAFLLEPYVENAIWHGLAPKEGQGHLRIEIATDAETIHCLVEDNGIGRRMAGEIRANKLSDRRPMGTRITEKRLDLLNKLYKRQIRVRTTDLFGDQGEAAGTSVEITLTKELR